MIKIEFGKIIKQVKYRFSRNYPVFFLINSLLVVCFAFLLFFLSYNINRFISLSLDNFIENNIFLLTVFFIIMVFINLLITYYWLKRGPDQGSIYVRNNENYYRSLFKENKTINLIIDPETGYIKDANNTALNFYGYKRRAIRRKKITDINIQTDAEIFEEMEKARREERNYFEFTHRLADGSLREVEVYSNPVLIEGKEYLYSFIYDITEREKLERRVRKQERNYQTLFETTGTATFFIEEDFTISLVNQEVVNLTGFTKDEIEGKKKFPEFIAYPEERTKMLEYHRIRRQNEESVSSRYEFNLRDKDKNIKAVLINVRMIKNTNQSIVSLVDITERKKQQQELIKTYQKLSDNMDKARMIHQRFLPSGSPEIENLSFAAYYHSSDKIGSDFYNYIQLKDRLIFYIVDITGHGLEGAMLNIFIRETINNYIIKNENHSDSLEPAKIIEYLAQKYKQEEFPEDYFICMILGVLDLNTYQLRISNMGVHVLPLVSNIDSIPQELSIAGLPITNTLELDYYSFENIEEAVFYLKPGTTLVLSTDGLIEENSNNEIFGDQRLKKIVSSKNGLPPRVIVDNIKRELKLFQGNSVYKELISKDDITYLLIQRDIPADAYYSMTIKSETAEIYNLQDEIRDILVPYTVNIDEIIVVFHEILSNAVEHGNKLDISKQVEIEMRITDIYIEIVIRDQGKGFDWQEKLYRYTGLEESYNMNDIRERGRGLLLTSEFLDYLLYNEKGNEAYLYKFLND